MRIAFLVVTAVWLALSVFVLYWFRDIYIWGIRFTVGMGTFCLAVCAILDALRRIERRLQTTRGGSVEPAS